MTQLATAVGRIANSVLTPLCERSADLLKPIDLLPNDRLLLELDEDGTNFIAHPYGDFGDGRRVQSSSSTRGAWQIRMPECKDRGANRWEIAATDFNALIINAVWPSHQLVFGEGARETYEYLLTRFLGQTVNAHIRAAYKIEGENPSMPGWFNDHPEKDKQLSKYQCVGLVGSAFQDAACLFMEQGTGKTPVGIARIMNEAQVFRAKELVASKEENRAPRTYNCIIVCPKNVRINWAKELAKFATVPGRVTTLRGCAMTRTKQIIEAMTPDEDSIFSVIIVSYDACIRSWNTLRLIPWQLCIMDEAHYIKSPYNKRQTEFLKMRDSFEQRMLLTGTPVTNSLLDLWGLFEFCGEGLSGFKSWRKFKKYYCAFDKEDTEGDKKRKPADVKMMEDKQAGNMGIPLSKYSNVPLLQERLNRLAFMITKKEAMPFLPEKTYDLVEVEMGPAQRKAYVQLQEQLALEFENDDGSSNTMTPQNILVQMLRLAQITSGFQAWDRKLNEDTGEPLEGPREITFFDSTPKLDALAELMASKDPQSKTTIWACFKPDIMKIAERLRSMGLKGVTFTGQTSDKDRAEAERAFNNDADCRWFLGNPAAGGMGLNLRGYDPDTVGTDLDHGCNCDHVVYYSQNWSMVHRSQSEDRAHRRGTRVTVRYTDLVVPGTIDEEIRVRVMQKTMGAMQLQDVKAIMHRILKTRLEDDDE